IGFGQALLLAGAHSVVLSLWKVDDQATALLMQRFYQNLLSKRDERRAGGVNSSVKLLSKAEALREAKIWLRNLSGDQVNEAAERLPRGGEREKDTAPLTAVHPYAHPYYWSAFILIGDPD